MTWRWPEFARLHFRGRGGSWLALAGQFIVLIGLPLPRASAKDLSQPFPCQKRACGCVTANDCWTSCCCFSAGSRVAWARDHGVTPPAPLVAEADKESDDAERKPCCSEKHAVAKATPTKTGAAVRWLLTIQAKRCHGALGEEGQLSPGYPPGAPTCWNFEWTVAAAISFNSNDPILVAHLPPLPPPRV